MVFFDIYAKWYENQTEHTKQIVKRLFDGSKNMYISNASGKVRLHDKTNK